MVTDYTDEKELNDKMVLDQGLLLTPDQETGLRLLLRKVGGGLSLIDCFLFAADDGRAKVVINFGIRINGEPQAEHFPITWLNKQDAIFDWAVGQLQGKRVKYEKERAVDDKVKRIIRNTAMGDVVIEAPDSEG